MRQSKYKNKKVQTPDGSFDSVKEYKRWNVLKKAEADGDIQELRRQVPFELIPHQVLETPRKRKGKSHTVQKTELAVKYFADFTYKVNGKLVVEDTKGVKTPEYIIKRKLMKWVHNIEIVEV